MSKKKPAKRKEYSAATKKKAVEMYKKGASLVEIAKACKLTHGTSVYKWLDEQGVKRREPAVSKAAKKRSKKTTKKKSGARRKNKSGKTRNQYSDEIKARAVEMYQQGKTPEQIVKALKLTSESLVYSWLNKAGVASRRAASGGPQRKKVTKTRSKARRKEGDETLPEKQANPKHKKAAERVFSDAQKAFRKLIGECARDDDFEGVDFFNTFAAQTAAIRKQLVA